MSILDKLIDFEKSVALEYLEHIRDNFYDGKKTYKDLPTYFYYKMLENVDNFIYTPHGIHISGVYQLGDFYIGRSHNMKSRIVQHLIESLYEPEKLIENNIKKYNINKIIKTREALKSGLLKVIMLDKEYSKESEHIKNSKFNLTNASTKKLREVQKNYSQFNGIQI